MPIIQFAPSAVADLEAIIEHYADEGVPEVGSKTVTELVAATKALADYPEMGRIVPEFDAPMLRELIRPPYRLVYRLERNESISIIRIWRSERLLHLP